MASSYGSESSSSSWQSSPKLTPKRPTKDEACGLWEIMSTPPDSYKVYSQYKRGHANESNDEHNLKRPPQPLPPFNTCAKHLHVSPALVSPKSYEGSSALHSPLYESSLPHTPDINVSSSLPPGTGASAKRYVLQPRKSKRDESYALESKDSQNYGLGPYLGILPESVVYSIVSYIDYFERHPTLMLISRGMTGLLTSPEFMFEMKYAHKNVGSGLLSQMFGVGEGGAGEDVNFLSSSNELLFVVGGKVPTKANNNSFNNTNARGQDIQFMSSTSLLQPLDDGGINRRMVMQSYEHVGIMGYDPRRNKWMRFGGDPLAPFGNGYGSLSNAALHPLSPFGIVDAKPLYIGHPYYCLMLFGGTHHESGAPSNRVVAYSFLSGKWEYWTDMMRSRHGEDFVVARVEGPQCRKELDTNNQDWTQTQSHSDCVVLIGCDLEFCDCYRCNPSSSSSLQSGEERSDVKVDMISFIRNDDGAEGIASHKKRKEHANTMGRAEVLDLRSRQWHRRKKRSPSCPPDDGGVAVVGGRFVVLPGTCPPPPAAPTTWMHSQEGDSNGNNPGRASAAAITPLSQSEVNSSKSQTSTVVDNDQSTASSMDTDSENFADDGNVMSSPLGNLFRSLSYRPGLLYDFLLDVWYTLPSRPHITTSNPCVVTLDGSVVVLGGYRSSSENALSCYRHREADSILDYEDHLDYVWWYAPPSTSLPGQTQGKAEEDVDEEHIGDVGEWHFGGGTTTHGHREAWAHSDGMAQAVAAASSLKIESNIDEELSGASPVMNLPCQSPAAVRGAAATVYQGRLTMLGGLSTFSRTFYDSERKTIWQFFPGNHKGTPSKQGEWKRAPMILPASALLDGYAFSLHL